MTARSIALAAGAALLAPSVLLLAARQATPDAEAVANALTFRNLGPFRTGVWITDIAVPDSPAREHAYTIYAATRSGGLWKTSNAGVTWAPVSDNVEVGAVGAVAVAPSNHRVVWMGTGANDLARSSYSGKGVFKSTDAGATWQFMGLPDSQHIARIVIHPTNPDIVYVAAMGRLFSRNEERGVFRTRDGGRNWEKVLYVDDGTGAVDLVLNRRSPNTLYAAMYEKHRMPWQLVLGGPGTGIYRSDDGGTKWTKLAGGLPTGNLGRIGLDIHQRNPNILYAVVENVNPRPAEMGPAFDACQAGSAAAAAAMAAGRGGAGRGGRGGAQRIGNEIYRTDDGGKTWRKVNADAVDVAGGKAPYSFNQLRINPADPNHVIVTSDTMYSTTDGGASWGCSNTTGFFRSVFGDFRTMWWDAEDAQRIMIGSDGGLNVSVDGGRTADYSLNMRVGEVYAIGVDMDDPYNVYAGLQDHDSWKGPSNGPSGQITLEHWTTVGPGDGMYNQVDPTDSRWVYNTREMGNHGRFDQLTGQRTVIAPSRSPQHRYNWIAPIVLSPHNPQIVYAGAELLYRSLNRGDSWEEISPDLTTNDATKCGVGSGNVPYCNITSISESPLRAGIIWVGTDDGKVQVTLDHGKSWTDATPALVSAGAVVDRAVSRVFASPHDANTAFVTRNGFRHDDFRPFVYRTTDAGKTWSSVAGNLPDSPLNVVVQDRKSANLLVVGNDVGAYASIDGGGRWFRIKANLPTVPVHDLTIHPRENDLVLGTYGRGVFSGDITPLQELSADVLAKPLHLFAIEPRARYGFNAIGNYNLYGSRYIETPNEPEALAIHYYLRTPAADGARITVTDLRGAPVAELRGPGEAGLNRAYWNMRAGGAGRGGRGAGGGGGRGGGGGGEPAPEGDYLVTVTAGGQSMTGTGTIRPRIR
jgi:photosystem II stability/assembly factor-like uncharacterized protein